MEISEQFEEGYVILQLDGELDASSAIPLNHKIKDLFDKEHYRILFDFEDLAYISSAGLGVFISILKDFKEKQGFLGFYNMSEMVHDVFRIVGLDKVLAIYDDKPTALDHLNAWTA